VSRKIDAAIAEHIFGHTVHGKKEGKPFRSIIGGGGGWTERVPEYSTSIAEAWSVLNKLTDEGYSCTIYQNPTASMNGCVFIKGSENHSHLHPTVSVPMSIALAALRSKGIEVEDD
jgi:hypothetical protein